MTEMEKIRKERDTLEYELGRWKKRCEDRDKQIEELMQYAKAIRSVNMVMDATLIQITLEHSEADFDEAEEFRFRYKMPEVHELVESYALAVEKTEDGDLVLHVTPREGEPEEDDEDGEE